MTPPSRQPTKSPPARNPGPAATKDVESALSVAAAGGVMARVAVADESRVKVKGKERIVRLVVIAVSVAKKGIVPNVVHGRSVRNAVRVPSSKAARTVHLGSHGSHANHASRAKVGNHVKAAALANPVVINARAKHSRSDNPT